MNKKGLTGVCPVCDAQVPLASDITESEVISCPDCKTRLVVESIEKGKVKLAEAPKVEEDWGE